MSSIGSTESPQRECNWFKNWCFSGGEAVPDPRYLDHLDDLMRCIDAQPTAPLVGDVSKVVFDLRRAGQFFDYPDGIWRCRHFKKDASMKVSFGISLATLSLPEDQFCHRLTEIYLEAAQAAVSHAAKKRLDFDATTFLARMKAAMLAFLIGDIPPKPGSDRIRAPRPAVIRFVGAESFGITDSLGDFWPQVFACAQRDETKLFVVPSFVAKGLVEPMLYDAGPSICIAHDRSTYVAWPCSRLSKKDAEDKQSHFKHWSEFWFMMSHAIADMYWVESVVVLDETIEALPGPVVSKSAAKEAVARYVAEGSFTVAD